MRSRNSGKVLSELSEPGGALSVQLPTAQKIYLTINAGSLGASFNRSKWQVGCCSLLKGDLREPTFS
jgi:hypothetical protein